MRVLMLDKNILVDRRIDLFAMSLNALGHQTRLLYLQPPESFEERFTVFVEAIPVGNTPEAEAAVSSGLLPRPAHVRDVLHPFSRDPRGRVVELDQVTIALSKETGSLPPWAKIWLALKFPEIYVQRLSLRGKLSLTERVMGAGLGFLASARGFTNFMVPPLDDYPTVAPSGVKLTPFDRGAIRHAVEVWQPTVVTANDFPTLRAALTIKRLIGTPVIYDAHELYSYQPGVPQAEARRIFAEERRLLKQIDGLIVMNELQARVMERDFGYRGPYAVCTNATNRPQGFGVGRRYDRFRERLPIPAHHKIMLFQGGINTGRRIDFVLRGLAKARRGDVHMVFLTWGQEVPEFKAMAAELGLASRVHFLPFVDWDEVLFYAASADCGFMPYQATDQNTAISSPNKMYEFIMAGTPMIGSSDLHYVKEIVGGEGFGVVRPLRADIDYALAIEEMFDESLGGSQRFWPALIEKGDGYSWDREVAAALHLYEMVASKPTKRQFKPKAVGRAQRIMSAEDRP